MPLQSRRHFLRQSAALAAGVYGSRAFSDGRQTRAVTQADSGGGRAAIDTTAIASAVSAGALGRLREVICWTEARQPESGLVSGQNAFRVRGCHLLAGPFFALGLEHPATIYAAGLSAPGTEFPDAMAVRYEFAEQTDRPGLVLTWYDGAWAPPYESVDGFALSARGTLYLGQDGQLLDDGVTGRRILLRDGEQPQELPAAVSQFGQSPSGSAEYSQLVDAAVVAGIVSYRVQQSLDWDGPTMCARNCPQASALIRESLDMTRGVEFVG